MKSKENSDYYASRILPVLATIVSVAALGILSEAGNSAAGGGAGGSSGVTRECDETICKVQLIRSTFNPDTLKIKSGTTVVWTNTDKMYHTVTARAMGSNAALFDSGTSSPLKSGSDWQYKFPATAEGTFEYFCQLHPMMVGKVMVTKSADQDPARLSYMILAGAGISGAFAAAAIVTRKKR